MKKESVPVRNSLLLLLTATIWGVAFVAQSVSMDYIGGFTFNAVRNIIGAIALLPVIWGLGKTRSASEQTPSDRKTLITGKAKEKKISALMYVLAVLFVLKYIFI